MNLSLPHVVDSWQNFTKAPNSIFVSRYFLTATTKQTKRRREEGWREHAGRTKGGLPFGPVRTTWSGQLPGWALEPERNGCQWDQFNGNQARSATDKAWSCWHPGTQNCETPNYPHPHIQRSHAPAARKQQSASGSLNPYPREQTRTVPRGVYFI